MRYRDLWVGAFVGMMGVVASGCGSNVETVPIVIPAQSGRLTVLWTVEGSTSPSICGAVQADAFELVIIDTRGNTVAVVEANCENFALVVDLPAGTYSANATLIDVANRSASTTIALDNIHIIDGTALTIDTDFPLSSIL